MRTHVCIGCVLLFSLLTGGSAGQLHREHSPAVGSSATLLPGMGSHHHHIATRNPQAQRFFDQGLVLGFGFNHDEAARSFRQAMELDPEAAMPCWGLAWALGPRYALAALTPGSDIFLDIDVERERFAAEAIQRALRLSTHAPRNERRYIEALAQRYSIDPHASRKNLLSSYKEAMRSLTREYPDDLDAAVLYAESLMELRPWQLWKPDGTPEPGTLEAVGVLEAVLGRNPNHPGANHYYIHAVEGSPNPERALPSAERLMTLVPGAGHLLHMPAHIYFQTGDYESLAITNQRAADVDRDYIAHTNATGIYPLMFYPHNLHFVAVARAAQGRYNDAKVAAEKLAAAVAPTVQQMPMAETWLAQPLFVQLRFHRWNEILAEPSPKSEFRTFSALWHFARAVAFVETGKQLNARREADLFESARSGIPPEALYVNGNNTARNVVQVAAAVLSARLAADLKASVELWKKAVQTEDELIYDEPPPWYYPVRESLGAALLRAGQPVEAEAIFREDLKKNKRNGRSLFGLLASLEAQGRTSEADWVRQEYERAWKGEPLRIEDL